MNLTLRFLSEKNITVFTLEFHILAPLPNLTQIWSSSNILDHTCHLVSPFSLPTLFFDGSALCIDLVCQKIVTGSTGSFAARGAGSHVAGNAVHLAAAGGFGSGDIGNSSVVVAVCHPIECMGCSAGGAKHFVVVVLGPCTSQSQSFSIFLQMGQFGPHPHFSFICLGTTVTWGITVLWGCASTFIVGVNVG